MSYILDALRKADAERARGAVPGLNSQPLPQLVLPDVAKGVPAGRWRLAAMAAALAAVALVTWWLAGTRGSPAGPASRAPAQATSGPTAAAGVVAPTSPAAPAQSVALAPPAPPAESIALPTPPATAAAPQAARRAEVSPPVSPSPRAAVAPATPAPARVAPPPGSAVYVMPPGGADLDPGEGRVPLLSELPEATRRQLPPLKLGGSVFSEQPASRFVMIDGQLLREGDTFGPGLVVERIGQRSVRIFWRESRFELRW